MTKIWYQPQKTDKLRLIRFLLPIHSLRGTFTDTAVFKDYKGAVSIRESMGGKEKDSRNIPLRFRHIKSSHDVKNHGDNYFL